MEPESACGKISGGTEGGGMAGGQLRLLGRGAIESTIHVIGMEVEQQGTSWHNHARIVGWQTMPQAEVARCLRGSLAFTMEGLCT